MNTELLQKFDHYRDLPIRGTEGLAQFLHKEGIRFATKDLATWVEFLSGRLGGTVQVPEWLVSIFCTLANVDSPKIICDPCAGVGFLVEALREACQPKQALAFTQNRAEHELGKVLVPEVGWQLGDTTHLLEALPHPLDVVASILPWGVRARESLKVKLVSGEAVELADELGNLVMVAASQRLSSAGIGLFVVTPAFFSKQQSVFHRFSELGLGVDAAMALPSGTFAPFTNISGYLVIVRRKPSTRMFVAQFSADTNTNLQVIANFRKGREGGSLELGGFADAKTFRSFGYLRASEAMSAAEKRFGVWAAGLDQLGHLKKNIRRDWGYRLAKEADIRAKEADIRAYDPDIKIKYELPTFIAPWNRVGGPFEAEINLGRPSDGFSFEPLDNAIYIPLIGNSDVVVSPDDLTLKLQNYAQVVIDPSQSNAIFVAMFLNSEIGKELRVQAKTGFIPKLNKRTLRDLRVLVPDLEAQKHMLEVETRITTEQTTVMALQNEISELRRELWANPKSAPQVDERIVVLAGRLAGGINQYALARLDQWFETLPFPLASILRAWQATPSQDFKTKYEHLLHFFEGAAEFFSVILLSAFNSNERVFSAYRQDMAVKMRKANLSYRLASFGTWSFVVAYLGSKTRDLLNVGGGRLGNTSDASLLCGEMFADSSLSLPRALSRKGLSTIFATTNTMRNRWKAHGGVVGQTEAESRNEQLLAEVQKLREAISDIWSETQMIHALHCRYHGNVYDTEVAVLMGSNNEFLKENRALTMCLDVERLYLSTGGSGRALKLLPLIQIGPSPQSAKNACYFFSRLDQVGACFVSYHFTDKPELTGLFADATDAIRLLGENY